MKLTSCRVDNPNADEECYSDNEINKIANGLRFHIMYMNKYFDPGEFNGNPIKEYIDYLYFGVLGENVQA
jgi:hypothetical protein